MFMSIMEEHQSVTCIDTYVRTVVKKINISKDCLFFEH